MSSNGDYIQKISLKLDFLSHNMNMHEKIQNLKNV